MDMDYINRLPIELRREIYMSIPKRQCLICNKQIMTHCHVKEFSICSVHCCMKFNKSVLKEVIISNTHVSFYNIVLMCNYIFFKLAVFTCYSTGSFLYIITAMATIKKIVYLSVYMVYYLIMSFILVP